MSNHFAARYSGPSVSYLFNSESPVFGRVPHHTVNPHLHEVVKHVPTNIPQWGNTFKVRITPKFHKMGEIILRIKTGPLRYNNLKSMGGTDANPTIAGGFNASRNDNTSPHYLVWKNHVAYNLIRGVRYISGSEQLFETNGNIMYFSNHLDHEDKYWKTDEYHSYQYLDPASLVSTMLNVTDMNGLDMYIHIPLPHDTKVGDYFSLNNISQEQFIEIDFAPLADMVFVRPDTGTNNYRIVSTSSGTVTTYNPTLLSCDINEAFILTNNYQLIPSEGEQYAMVAESIPIRHYQVQRGYPIVPNTSTIHVDLSSLAPTQTLFIVIRDNSRTANDINGVFNTWTDNYENVTLLLDTYKDIDPEIFTRKYIKELHMPTRFVNKKFSKEVPMIAICYADHNLTDIPTGIVAFEALGSKQLEIKMRSPLTAGAEVDIYYYRWNWLEYDGHGRVKTHQL